ncbi:MAG: S41 family peptidase [Anaerolineales bacterium]
MNKWLKYSLLGFLVIALTLSGFAGGFVAGHSLATSNQPLLALPGAPAITTPQAANSATPSDYQTLFKPFWEAWDLVHKQYVDQPVDDTLLMQGAIRGMLASLGDQHTSYMDPSQFTQANSELSGEYSGIGAWVDTSGEWLTINSPMPGSPAEKAGLLPGDVIIKVDGDDMTGVPPELVIKRVLGPQGTLVKLTVMRQGEAKPLEFEVTRAKIVVPSVEGKMLDNGVAYVKISTFGDKTTSELKATLTELMKQNPRGMVLDLRNNGGGYLQTAVEVMSQFLEGGQTVLIEKYGDGTQQKYESQAGGLATKIPLVVLVNEYSASASEITAGAIQDYGRGKLVGVTTYGKGSVQIWTPLNDEKGAVRITVAKWYTPLDRTIHKVGLTPDVVVEMTEADHTAKRDPQLDAALKTLEEIIAAAK